MLFYIGNSGYAQNLEQNLNYISNLNVLNELFLDIYSPNKKKLNLSINFNYSAWDGLEDYFLPPIIEKRILELYRCIINYFLIIYLESLSLMFNLVCQ